MNHHITDEQSQQRQEERHIFFLMIKPENRAMAITGEKPDHSSRVRKKKFTGCCAGYQG